MPPNVINHCANVFFNWRGPVDFNAIATQNTFNYGSSNTERIIRQLCDTFVTANQSFLKQINKPRLFTKM